MFTQRSLGFCVILFFNALHAEYGKLQNMERSTSERATSGACIKNLFCYEQGEVRIVWGTSEFPYAA